MKRSRILCACTGALLTLLVPSFAAALIEDGLPAPNASGAAPSTGAAPVETTYRVGPEDVLRVRVARHEDLGGEVVVLQDGRIVLPVVGNLTVTGLTVEQIREQVTKSLRKKLVNPEVSVDVVRPRPRRVFISGLVKAPQPLDLKEGWRLTEALANAGGLLLRPEVARGTLFRLPDETIILDLARVYVDQDPAANVRLQPGDVIDGAAGWWTRFRSPRGQRRALRSARAMSSRRTAARSRSTWPA
jgi:protein involved in polysaccharide export with SLBB domain